MAIGRRCLQPSAVHQIERIAAPGFILEPVNLAGFHSSNERTAQIKSDLQSVEDILQQTATFENFEE